MSKTRWIIGIGLVGALSVVALGAAAEHRHGGYYGWHKGGGGYGHGHHHRGRKMLRQLKRADANKDGKVTLEEFLARREARFAELDGDNDGKLSADDIVRPLEEHADYRVRRMMKRFDADGDGRITKSEFEAPARKRFAERDFNGDGEISDDERPPRGRGYGPGGRGGPPSEGADAGDDAAPEGRRGGRRGHHGRGAHRARSLEKVLERTGRRFDRLDANNDGAIEPSEISAQRAERLAFAKKKRMHVLDTNRDGEISREEFLAKRKDRFALIDLNGNGVIEADDLPPRAARRWNQSDK